MGRQIIIGKEGNQPFALQDPKVSRRHAYLNIDDSGNLILIDNQSTNGTYIYNGQTFVRLYPNQQYKVTADSMIQLGPETRFHVRKLLSNEVNKPVQTPQKPKTPEKPKPAAQPRKVNIAILRRVSEVYERNKMEIESKAGMINSLRSCTIIISLLAGSAGTILTNQLGSENAVTISIAIAVGAVVLMVILLAVINGYNKKIMQRRKDNEKNYSIRYVCPECKVSFRGKIYENILAEGKCPKCKSVYYEQSTGM